MATRKKDENGLDRRETLFVQEYLADSELNAHKAAIAAGYSPTTAKKKSFLWVTPKREDSIKPHVWDAIQKAMDERAERAQVDADYVLKRITEIDQMDFIDILNDDMSFKPVSEWPPIWRQYISGLDINEVTMAGNDQEALSRVMRKIKWPDKVKNLEMMGKHISVQAFRESKHVTGGLTLETLLDECEDDTGPGGA